MKKIVGAILIALAVIGVIFGAFAVAKLLHSNNVATGKGKATSLNAATVAALNPAQQERATETAAADNTKAEAFTSDEVEEIKDFLRVDLNEYDLGKLYSGYSLEFLNSSTVGKAVERAAAPAAHGWAGTKMFDAVSFPFSCTEKGKKYAPEDVEAMKEELREELMRNPVFGDMLCQGMAEMKLPDGTTVAEINPWAAELVSKYDEEGLNGFITYHTTDWSVLGYEPNPRNSDFILDKKGDKKVFVTDEYVKYGKLLCIFLDRCTALGVENNISTSRHYVNVVGEPEKVRTTLNKDSSYLDKEPALVFVLEYKDRQVLKFGFNIYDKRLELFEAKKSSTSVTPTPGKSTPTPTPKPTPGGNPTPTPEPTPTPGDEPTPTPDDPTPTPRDQKNPKDDAVHKGNADENGGEGNGNTGEPTEPGDGQGHGDPGETKPDEPTPKPGQGGNDDSNPPDYGEGDHNLPPVGGDDNPPGGEYDGPPD